jgi:hypothetical protein
MAIIYVKTDATGNGSSSILKLICASAIATLNLCFITSNQAQAFNLSFFSPTVFSSDSTILNQNVGITGYTIEDFEDTTLIPGLSINLSGDVPNTTFTTLPNLSVLLAAPWNGNHTLTNIPDNINKSLAVCLVCAKLTTFSFSNSITSVGIGLSGFQSLNPPPLIPGDVARTNHRLFINGTALASTIESLGGVNWIPSTFGRNTYLRIDAEPGEFITSIGFENITNSISNNDVLEFDYLAIQTSQTTAVPEPSIILGIVTLGLGAVLSKKRNQDNSNDS